VPGVPPPSPPVILIHGSQTTHVTITRFPVVSPSPGATAGPSERIDIEVHQDGGATVPVIVPTQAPSLPPSVAVAVTPSADEHSRLGVFAGTIPGLLAVDVQIIRLYPLAPLARWKFVPPALGQIEASLDAEVNLKQAGLMVTTGGKVYGGVGGYGSWDMQAGWMGGVGMRF
jgi:hypothetical protein